VTDLVRLAFRALGDGPTWRELELVADAIRESGDEPALALFEGWGTFDALVAVAEEAGAGGLVALDLLTEVSNPGWCEGRGCWPRLSGA
jgi:hypothetical protein